MKISALVVAATALASLSASAALLPSRKECTTKINLLQTSVKMAESKFGVGESSRTDVLQARLDLLNQQLTCGAITREQYCTQENLGMMKDIVQGIVDERNVGQRDSLEVQQALLKQADMNGICE